MRSLIGPWLFVGWTLFVWGTRIRNIANDDDLGGLEQLWRTGLAVGLTVGALAAAAALVTKRGVRPVFASLGLLTVATWLFRGVSIALADHDAAFIVVHLVLAATSIGLAAFSWRAVSRQST